MSLAGGCVCGGVRFEVTEPLVTAGWCHCTRCRRRTGTPASVQATIVPGSLRILRGKQLVHGYWPGGDSFVKEFCSVCGSHLWSRHPDEKQRVSVRLGAFDGDPGIRPSHRQFVADAVSWEPIPDDGLPRFPGRRPTT